MLHQLPITQDGMILAMVHSHVNHQLSVQQVSEMGFELPKSKCMLEFALAIKDKPGQDALRNLRKIAQEEIAKLQNPPTQSQINACVDRIIEQM